LTPHDSDALSSSPTLLVDVGALLEGAVEVDLAHLAAQHRLGELRDAKT
jgi:hypothetical protein